VPNLGSVIRGEFTRLSRRSTEALFMPLKKDVSELKRIVVDQRRSIEALTRANARLIADLNSRIARLPEVSEQEAQKVRISPRLIKPREAGSGSLRRSLGSSWA